ncbi:MAG TPA: MBL fold metallo-hydrolase [Bryobacteraceae bacterium]|nr:MBL fold metallo-hydrolase [Bryobacteraceae bacterium]HOQ45079.1 MBL fold metallo-hydrolase [Bryobacteraceae bacterium]HPQ13708.1 MBL fold metallo-hydrolase [Bryobacteraceae bacterium]HPU71151.1 MBL fold metallo-hydrolase [Bryobacteraceae bacterium]
MARTTRRRFLTSAGAAAAAPAASSAPQAQRRYTRTTFAPTGAPRRLSENLWLFEDTCNVYVIRDGSSAVLIDFGSGKILDHLPGLGISKVNWILHTHHHRDQCQGDWKAVERRIPIAVPAHEAHLFADAENFWRNRRVFHLYYVRNDFNTITENIPVARKLEDYTTFRWNRTEFFILPAPGHTLGSIALLATIDGSLAAFTGDLIYAPGKILNLYDTQINYGGAEGVDHGIYSLARLRERKPSLLCPSHGEPMRDPEPAISETIRRLSAYYRFQVGEPSETFRPFPVSRHLIAHHLTNASFYAIISSSGKAMFVDYGSASNMHFSTFERATAATDRIRFVEHNIEELKRTYGLKSIDVAIPSHMHDDHINGFPHLMRNYGTQIWCYENMVDVFQNPRGYNLGCILGEPIKISRTFRHGERFRWEEFEFEITHSPGHTEYQMAMYVTIDGKRVAFTGDAFFENPRRDGTLRHNLIFRNHVENDSHLKSIRNLIEHEPEIICPGHGRPYAVDRATLLATEKKLTRQQQFFFDLLPEGETNFGLDPSWVSIYPYQIVLRAGESRRIEVRVQNYRAAPMKLEIALVAPAEWKIVPDVLRFEAPAGGKAARTLTLSVPRNWEAPGPRFAIAADVVSDGRYLGQITEAIVELAG